LSKRGLRAWITLQIDNVGPGLRKILGNMSWLFVDRAVRMGMGLFVGVWIARYLGPAKFGSLNFAVAFVALFGTVACYHGSELHIFWACPQGLGERSKGKL
jgi:hypothetical protein